MSNPIIPIDNRITEFSHHLDSHPRTILSAKYGDGKTFFLSNFIKEKKDRYVSIVLHPVNYQVMENKDIFDLIKRDILFQILKEGIIENDYVLTDSQMAALYIQNNCLSLAEMILPYLSAIGSDEIVSKSVMGSLVTLQLFKKIKDKFKEFKKDNTLDGILTSFVDKTENSSIYESDIISRIISANIFSYKKNHPDKKIVLVIEDLDRIDPAHLFRIMNIFSAHIDYSYKYFVQPDKDMIGNKFGFDNVVFVLDYQNTRRIFNHFYGENTNFKGYIDKFCSNGYFEYSLKTETENYIYNTISEEVGFRVDLVKGIIPMSTFDNLSLRNIVNAITNTKIQICKDPIINDKGREVKLHLGLLRLLVILRRLGIENDTIISDFASRMEKQNEEVMAYFCSYIILTSSMSTKGLFFHEGLYNNNNVVEFHDLKDNGEIENIRFFRQTGAMPRSVDFKHIVEMMLGYISICFSFFILILGNMLLCVLLFSILFSLFLRIQKRFPKIVVPLHSEFALCGFQDIVG